MGNVADQKSDSPDVIIHKVVDHFFESHNNFSTQKSVWGGYTMDITFEAMLFYDIYTGKNLYTKKVSDIMTLRNLKPSDTVSYKSQPFGSYNYALYKATGNKEYVNPYVSETIKMMKEVKRSPEGAVMIHHKNKTEKTGRYYVLIDYIQEYCSRVARAGALTRDTLFYKESTEQYEIYRDLLRNPENGLYSQGRGWLADTTKLSPGAWSRGHGWLMRGIVPAMEAVPFQSTYYYRLQAVLKEMADALLKVQDKNGMWHQLPHLSFDKSYPETSGTGMIAYYLAVAYKKGFLKDEKYRDAALLAAKELRNYVTDDGIVLGACKGPGPLRTIEPWLNKPALPDDHHGPQAIIYGMLAEIILQKPIYKNANVSIEDRVNDLMNQMTLKDKIIQIQFGMKNYIHEMKNDPGMVFALFNSLAPDEAARKYNEMQARYINNTRLGIPVLMEEEGIFGVMGYKTTGFPHSIALASSWDTDLYVKMAEVIAAETKARGCRHLFSPVVNLGRDVRWGRIHETYGEDPFLCSKMGVAYVKTMEQNGIISTPKHFVANMGLDGKFGSPVHFSERLLREQYFPAFKASIVEGGAKCVMTAYNTLDGIPCATNKWLMTDILRNEWGFDGFIVSDGNALPIVYQAYHTAETKKELAAQAMNAGCDVELSHMFYKEPLIQAVKDGLVSEKKIDDAVKRVLTQKFRVGLFDDPYVDPEYAGKITDSDEHRAVTLEVARECMILLKNENQTLPFSKDIKSIAVLGPLANEIKGDHYNGYGKKLVSVMEGIKNIVPDAQVNYEKGAEIGYYAYPAIHSDRFTTIVKGKTINGLKGEYFNNSDFFGDPIFTRIDKNIEFDWDYGSPGQGIPNDHFSVRWTGKIIAPASGKYMIGANVDDGIRVYLDNKLVLDAWRGGARRLEETEIEIEKDRIYDIKVEYFEGTYGSYVSLGWNVDPLINIHRAVEFAKKSDVAVIVVGSMSAENADRAILNLNRPQEELIKAVTATGTPTVVVLQTGNIITMRNWIDNTPAVIEAWYPGEEGGNAIAEVIFGEVNPSGKLPITIPKELGQVPLNYNHLPFKPKDAYIGIGNDPLFPFGHGLSYTNFEYSNLKLSSQKIGKTENIRISADIRNSGKVAGAEIIQLYIHDKIASIVRPVMELKGFDKINLKPNETKTVTFELTPELLSIYDIDMNFIVEPGEFKVMIGSSSEDIRLKSVFSVE